MASMWNQESTSPFLCVECIGTIEGFTIIGKASYLALYILMLIQPTLLDMSDIPAAAVSR